MAKTSTLTLLCILIVFTLQNFSCYCYGSFVKGGDITLEGNFTVFGNYNRDRISNFTERWDVHATKNMLIRVDFSNFNITYTPFCIIGYLEIYDGKSISDSPLIQNRRLCGAQSVRNFVSSTSDLVFIFYNYGFIGGFTATVSPENSCDSNSEFSCWDGTCVSKQKQCNEIRDCVDDSDEIEGCVYPHAYYGQCGKPSIPPQFTWDPRTRIIGGEIVAAGSWPWQVGLYKSALRPTNYTGLYCGGSLISGEWVLTAAHCVIDTGSNFLIVYAGKTSRFSEENTEQGSYVDAAYIHPNYRDVNYGYDIALLKLRTKMIFTDYVQPICLPTNATELPLDGDTCIATGWGAIEPGKIFASALNLRQVRLQLRGRPYCKTFFREFGSVMSETIFCAGVSPLQSADTCQGDSGGPLVCLIGENTWYQVGITSFGNSCGVNPGFYSSVAELYTWIEQITGLDLDQTGSATKSTAPTLSLLWIITALVGSSLMRL